ncbi:MAG: hypothetical protein A49_02350 [Methyloceanibacter sp.]|nr:MAG: hypothetical protein A49_02350 [Methyloceanibacter sp.]
MSTPLRAVRVIGIHQVAPSPQQFEEALDIMWGDDLRGAELERAQQNVREHFEGLYLLEVEVEPADADVDWGEFTQPIDDTPRENWQAPWDERAVGDDGTRWAFFLHYLDPNRPLLTPIGECPLPRPTPTPQHLADIVYDVPG